MKWSHGQFLDDDVRPILRVKDLDARSGWSDISDQSREVTISWAQSKEVCIVSGNLRMVNMKIYKLWCQDLVFLEYCTAFLIEFPVDTSELPKELPNW